MARSVRKSSNSNRRINRNSNRNTKKSRKSQNRNQRRNRSQRKNKSQRRNRQSRRNSRRNSSNKRGGALPAYRLHQEEGLLNRINPHAHALPLTYEGDHVVENHSNPYSLSH